VIIYYYVKKVISQIASSSF